MERYLQIRLPAISFCWIGWTRIQWGDQIVRSCYLKARASLVGKTNSLYHHHKSDTQRQTFDQHEFDGQD